MFCLIVLEVEKHVQEEINNKPCSYFGQAKYMHVATKVKFDMKMPLVLTRSLMTIIKLESRQANENLSYGNILLFYKICYCMCLPPRVIFCEIGNYLNLVREKIKQINILYRNNSGNSCHNLYHACL